MTTLRVLLHVAAQRDYELHSLYFSTDFLQSSLHDEIWLRRPPGLTGSFPARTQWSLQRPVYGLRQAPRKWHDTLRTTLAALGFPPSTADPSMFLRTHTSLPPLYVLVYIDDLVFATAGTEALTLLADHPGQSTTHHYPDLVTLGAPAPPSDEFVEPSGLYPELVGCLITSGIALVLGGRGPVVLTSHADASWVYDSATQRSLQGYTFSLCSGSVSWRATRLSSVLSSSCEAEIFSGAMAAQKLRWLTYLLTDVGEQPRSPPVLYVDNKAMIALCQEERLEHRTKHIALRYFLARELQQRGQFRLAYVATRANTADIFTKALPHGDHQHFSTVLGLLALLFLTAGPSGSGGMRGAGEAGRGVAGGYAPTTSVSTPAKDCGPKAWKILKDVHAPSSEAMVVVLERQLYAVKINEGDAVQGVFDQLRDLYVKLSAAGVDYPEKIKCYKALSLLPELWGPLVVNLNGMKDLWSIEWIHAQVLQEEFRRKELTAAAGEGGGSAYGMKGFKGHGSKKGKAKEGSGGEQYSGGKRGNKGGKLCGGKCWYCHVEGHPWFKCRKLPDGWRPGQPSIEGSKGVHGAMGEGMGSEEGDGGAGGHGGMFYHVGEACSEDMVVPASKVALHRSSHWHWVPMEKWSGKKPLVDMLRVFGCMGLVHVPKEKRDKLQVAAVWAVHLGLARGSKGWLMWDPKSNSIFTTRDAKFMEGLMFKEWLEQGRSKVTIPLGIEVGTNDPLLIPIKLFSSSELTEVSHDLGGAEGETTDVEGVLQQGEAHVAERGDTEEEVQQPTPSPKLPPRRTTQGKRDAVRGGAKEGAAKERPKRAAHPRDFLKYERLGGPKALLVQEEEDEEEKGAEREMEPICCFGVNLPHEPASMEEALAGDDREAWFASSEDEFKSHMENETWTLTNLPPGRKALDCTWVLRVKTDAEGKLERRKTRLVIKGFQQRREGTDFQEVFASVAKAPTLRVLLAAAAVCGWKVEQMDVKTAFLYGVVDEEIYMKQPEGYDDGSRLVCRLNKAIYGLKQAPSCWYVRLVEGLEALGFKVSGCDESFFMTAGEEKVFLLVYIDEIPLFSPSRERIKEVQGKLKESFPCKALGPVGYYLGLHVERDMVKGWLRLHQHKYLAAMGEKYGLKEGRSVKTLLPSGFQLHLDEEEGEVLEYELQCRFQSMAPSRAPGCSREAGEVLHGNLKGGAAIFSAWAAEEKGSGGGEHKDWCTCKAWALVPLVLHRCYLGK
ncbi:unnamed protein product [Closterium sp. NIES-53]